MSTAAGTDLAAVGAACGFATTLTATADGDVAPAVAAARHDKGPVLAVFKVAADIPPQVVPPRDGAHLVARFRSALDLPASTGPSSLDG